MLRPLVMDTAEGRAMFLRRCERAKNGKKHTYWALVESIRTAKGSRQRVVAYLGELKAGEKSGWAQLGPLLRAGRRRRGRRPATSLVVRRGIRHRGYAPTLRTGPGRHRASRSRHRSLGKASPAAFVCPRFVVRGPGRVTRIR